MHEVDRALAEIAGIRTQLARSAQFRGYSPESLAAIGVMALLLGLALDRWPALAAGNVGEVLAWGTLMLASCVALTVEALLRARRRHGALASDMTGAALKGMVPFTLTGAAATLVLARYAPQVLWFAPGLWLALTGLVCFSWAPIMPRSIVWPGIWYLAWALVLMIAGGRTGHTPPLAMAAAVGPGHLLIAHLLHRAERDARILP